VKPRNTTTLRTPRQRLSCGSFVESTIYQHRVQTAKSHTKISSARPSHAAFELAKEEDAGQEMGYGKSGQSNQARSKAFGMGMVMLCVLVAGTLWACIFMWFVMLLDQGLSLLLQKALWQH
jgi:hypothetical protein